MPIGSASAWPRRSARATKFYPWEALDPDAIVGLEAIASDAVNLKYLTAPLTKAQLDELVVKLAPQ
jgi:NitT/TauT family transport system substrate-binding protein